MTLGHWNHWAVVLGDVCKSDALHHNQSPVLTSRLDEGILCRAAELFASPLQFSFHGRLISVSSRYQVVFIRSKMSAQNFINSNELIFFLSHVILADCSGDFQLLFGIASKKKMGQTKRI